MNERLKTLDRVLSLSPSWRDDIEELKNQDFDSDNFLLLESNHIANALKKYAENRMDSLDLEYWADFIECRDDVKYEDNNGLLKNIIIEISNPFLFGYISVEKAESYISKIFKNN